MRHLSAILIILFLAAAPSCKFLKNKGLFGKKTTTLAALLAQQDSIRVADSIRKVQEQLLALEKAKVDTLQFGEETRQASLKNSRYNIIIGAFITPEFAKNLAGSFREKGYDTEIFKMGGSNFELVSAEGHESLSKAISRLRQFQDTVQFDAWIYIRK